MKTEALIIGGGVAGLSLACLLAQAGLKCAIVEPNNFPILEREDHSGRTAALMGSSINVLKAIGVWDYIQKNTAPLEIMRIIDDSNPNIEPVQVDFPASEINQENYGHNTPNLMLHALLAEKSQKSKNIEIIHGAKLQTINHLTNGVEATLDNGETIMASLIIGADGRNSAVRNLSGIETRTSNYDQSAITLLINHTKSHENISTEHHRTGGPFTTVPMPDTAEAIHQSSVVWVEKTDDAETFMALDKGSLENALQTRTRDALGRITLASTPEAWPLKGIIAEKIIAPRTALIAEAAHVMSPIGAQGLNLSLRDVATLAETLTDAARLGEDIGNELVLNRYAKRRSLDMNSRFYGVDKYNRIVSNNIGFIRDLRRTGLKSLKAIPMLKHLAMEQGLKPTMDEGRLIRGEVL